MPKIINAQLSGHPMFLERKIAGRFACGEGKCAYVSTFDLALYLKELVLTEESQQVAKLLKCSAI